MDYRNYLKKQVINKVNPYGTQDKFPVLSWATKEKPQDFFKNCRISLLTSSFEGWRPISKTMRPQLQPTTADMLFQNIILLILNYLEFFILILIQDLKPSLIGNLNLARNN